MSRRVEPSKGGHSPANKYESIGTKPENKPTLFNNRFVKNDPETLYNAPETGAQLQPLKERAKLRKKGGLFINSGGDQHTLTTQPISQLSTQETPKILFTVNHVDKKLKGFLDFDL